MQQSTITEIFSNAYFSLSVVWASELILSTALHFPQPEKIFNYSHYSLIIKTNLKNYAQKKTVYWPTPPLKWDQLSAFAQHTLKTLFQTVPFGQTISYTDLAQKIGKPKAARAIGQVMAKNPFPLIIPCHRVVAKHHLGGFTPHPKLKKILLQLEGIKLYQHQLPHTIIQTSQ
ncbi:MAG: MGMT family protein [Desulfonauticus sp.]|nr:MGMT family protein [Desulfonauticus sp.]